MLGLERPPRWGIVALIVLIVGNAAILTYIFLLRPAPVDPYHGSSLTGARSAPSAEPSDMAPSAADAGAGSPVLAVYGDGYTAGSALGGEGTRAWPALVSERLTVDLRRFAVSQAGYVSPGITGEAFPQLVSANPVPDADVVVVFGSRNDEGSDAAAVEEAAAATLATLRTTSPEAQLVIIGPAWSNASPPRVLDELSEAVERAATAIGAQYIDPLAEGWFAQPTTLIAPDGISPTDAGHAYLADLIVPVLEEALSTGAQPAA
jgi:lysophospholipase L1-like esterase